MIDSALHVLHGKASKDFLMDLTSNGSITEDEWARYVKTMTFEKQTMLKTDHVKRKIEDIKKAKEHIFTNEEISEMIEKKKAFSKMPQNAALEKMRLQAELGAAVDCGDNTKAQEFQEKLDDLEQKVKDATSTDEKLEQFKNVNAKNRDINFFEGREAERAAQMAKKEKGNRLYLSRGVPHSRNMN